MNLNCIRVFDEIPHDDPLTQPKRIVLNNALLWTICDQVLSGVVNTVVVDGRPGIGKTTIVDGVLARLRMANIPCSVVGSDDDVMERSKRNGYSLLDYHPGGVISEAARIHFDPRVLNGGELKFNKYNTATGCQDLPTNYLIHGQNGVLIAEGVRASEFIVQAVMAARSAVQNRVLFVFLDAPSDIINGRRFGRDVGAKGLSEEVAQGRIDTQEYDLLAYSGDMMRGFGLKGRVDFWNR